MKKSESAGRSLLLASAVVAAVLVVLAVRPERQGQGEPAIRGQEPVVARVELPFGAWDIAAVPTDGGRPGAWGPWALFALLGLLVVAPTLGAARLVASRQAQLALVREREAELSRLSWRLEFALAASQVGVWDADLGTDRLLWDERAKELFGHAGREGFFCEADWAGALHPDDRGRAMAEAAAAVAGDGRFVSEYRIVRPDGEVRHIRDMAMRYEGADGSRMVGLVWDITADVERQAELNLRRLEAEAATVAKSRFLAAMSHEIRTPMGGVLGLLGLMLEGPLEPEQRQRATVALASAQGLLGILNDILDFSKLEANQIRVSEEEVDPRQLVGEVMALMAAGAEQKGLALTHEVAAAVPERIVTDPMRLRQVLTNLVSNATKFTDAGHVAVRVDYGAGADGDRLLVEVEDTGIGISDEQAGQIFQHFVQADTSLARRAGGTGLGLAISKQLVELMGGSIGVRSGQGPGSTFAFSVRTRPGARMARRAPAPTALAPETVPPLRVLVAEDNATNRYVIEAYLRAAGHAVVTVGNGLEAVAAARTGGFDVVLMDVQMPRMDGLTAVRAIRALPGSAAAVPVIALTANAMAGDREDCLAAGMTDYLPKPIEVAALYAALVRIAPAPQPRRSVG
jgi:signal transduction histidine kinase/ActR/RegA family two-component response regulator